MNGQRDASPAHPTPPGTPTHAYTPHEVVAINLHIHGRPYRAVAMAHHDHLDGRRAYQLALWPALPDGRRTGWYWWNPETMTRRDLR